MARSAGKHGRAWSQPPPPPPQQQQQAQRIQWRLVLALRAKKKRAFALQAASGWPERQQQRQRQWWRVALT